MDVVGLSYVPSKGGQVSSSTQEAMGKNDFLKMLVAQLQAQDPLNPMDATGFTAQLAQFSALEQMQNVNGNLENLLTSQTIMTNSKAVDFIGKTVSALGNTITVDNGESTPIDVALSADAADTVISIYDAYGSFVTSLTPGPLTAGRQQIDWDGLNYQGDAVADGKFTYEVTAIDHENQVLDTTSFTTGLVTGVNFKNGQAYLATENQQIAMGDVVNVLSQTD